MNTLLNFFKEKTIEFNNKTFVLAISTGIDSAVLLDMFIKISKEYNLKVVVAHVNHHKRKQSEEEALYIKEYCEKNNLTYYIKDLYFDDLKDNFQSIAREKRYQFFEEVVRKVCGDYLVLAHHATDNTETVLMRILRGSSLKGYAGIQSVNEIKRDGVEYKIIRPLLSLSRSDISNYQKEYDVRYFEDESNSQNDYMRNRLRHYVLPLLNQEVSDVDQKFLEFSNVLYHAGLIIDQKRDQFIKEYVLKNDKDIKFSRSTFTSLDSFMQEEVLFELLKPYKLSKSNILELIKIIYSKKQSHQIYFKNQFAFLVDYDMICISQKYEEKDLKDFSLKITNVGNYIYDNFNINVIKTSSLDITNLNEMCYNISDLPIVIRTRRDGDKIKLKSGYKKVNDLFIDLKISAHKRDNILLAVDKNNEVLMIFGIRKSELVKKIDLKEDIIKITLEKLEN